MKSLITQCQCDMYKSELQWKRIDVTENYLKCRCRVGEGRGMFRRLSDGKVEFHF